MHTRWLVAALSGALVLAMAVWYADRPEELRPPQPPTDTAVVEAAPPAVTPKKASYVGNTNTYKFHRMSCRYSGCKNCTAYFASREDAIKAGYRPGGCCDP
jgi:hypothetical protein